MSTVKVVYISGKGRSGSTILDHVLGQLSGWFSAGELSHLWRWGLIDKARCGCGDPLPSCTVWSQVVRREPLASLNPATIERWQREVLSWPRLPRMLRQRPGRTERWQALGRYVDVLGGLYEAIADVTGARVVVDSSKWPAHPGLLGLVRGVEPFVLQLVRDPRAVAYSYRRRKLFLAHREPTEMPRFRPLHSATSWLARNVALEAVALRRVSPHRVVRYEDFTADPAAVVHSITKFVGEPRDTSVFTDHVVRLEPTHTVGGNPSRFSKGVTAIREDDEWQRDLPLVAGLVTTGVALPLLRRYGYPLLPSAARRRGTASLTP